MAKSNGIPVVKYGVIGLAVYLGLKYLTQPFVNSPYAVRLRAYIADAKSSGQNLFFTIRFENPNSSSLVVRSIVGDVYMNKLKVGTVAHYGTDIIKANAQSTINLKVSLLILPVIQNFLDVLANKTATQLLTFSGTVNINGQPQQINQSILL